MTPEEFAALAAAGHNRIPLTLDILADLETPLSVYLKLAHGQPYTYLLESAANGGEVWGRYSFIGLHARTVLRVRGHTVTVHVDDVLAEQHHCEDPLAFIEAFHARHKVPQLPGLPRFQGGLVGYFGYDTVRFIERKLADSSPPDDIGTPDILLMVSDDVIAFDNIKGRMTLISLARPDEPDAMARTRERLEGIAATLRRQAPLPPVPGANQPIAEDDFVSVFGQERYMAAVGRIRDYILAGDCMQVVLAQRMAAPYSGDALNLYRGLRYLNPSPYMFLMDLGDHQIVSSSPEILARLEDGVVTSRPLAGTRQRGRDAAEDLALEQELLADPKELAEHLMLIDLHRNDVGRVATTGSVEVTERFVIERYSHVMHISSNVRGRLREGCTAIDLLRATLPVGTLSGAPKVRAMEIIDELEPVRRGIYGGAVGYLAWNGNMDTAIAIRTAVLKDGKLYISAGAGVVADSVADLEWKETMNKARAIFAAAALAERGFRPLD